MLATRIDQWEEEISKKAEQKGRMEGEQKGRMEGRMEGRTEGQRQEAMLFLRRQLERRFGPLPEWANARLADAERETLEQWGLNVLDATTLEAVFR